MKPSSFCTICTKKYKEYLLCFLLTLSIHHENAIIYILCDRETKQYITDSTPKPKLKLKIYPTLNRYSLMTKKDMRKMGIWCDFQLTKLDIMKHAIEKSGDTLYLDCDNIIISSFTDINGEKRLGVSENYVNDDKILEIGKYSSGMVWCSDIKIIDEWINEIPMSRYYEQAALEEVVNKYSDVYFSFGENYNLRELRFDTDKFDEKNIASRFVILDNNIYYKGKILKNIHMRFKNKMNSVESYMLLKLRQSKKYREILCIFRCINKKWLIHIPLQPTSDKLFLHKNDRFRQLAFMMSMNNKDVEISTNSETFHCWLHPDVLFYDRPSLDWCNSEVAGSSLVLLGNCCDEIEGKELRNIGLQTRNWIFWPQNPLVVEKMLETYQEKEKDIDVLFIGDKELLPKHRDKRWLKIITKHIKSINFKGGVEYIKRSKFGVCVKPFRGKSNMMMELMAFGVVPIITSNVLVNTFEGMEENVHYVRVALPKQLERKLSNISDEKCKEMSKACKEWYMENVHSEKSWLKTINTILYS